MEGLLDFFYLTDQKEIGLYLGSFGFWSPFVSFGLMLTQAVVAPLPAFAISLGNGVLFGGFWGGLLSLISGTAAAFLCFELARKLGREWTKNKLGEKRFLKAEIWVERWGVWALVVLRLAPFLPFDPLSYIMGVSPMKRKKFLFANLLGQAPGAFFYAGLGAGIWQNLG